MTEAEWNLRQENARLKMALCQANSALAAAQFETAKAELQALGEKWEEPKVKSVK